MLLWKKKGPEIVAEWWLLGMVDRKVLSEEVMVTEDRLEKESKETFLRKQKIFVEA